MTCINPDSPVPFNVRDREFVFTAAGGITYAVATFAIVFFLLWAPVTFSTAHIVSFAAISTLEVTGFACFVLGMYVYSRKQKEQLEEVLEDVRIFTPVIIKKAELKTTAITTFDYIEQVRVHLPPLFDALRAFIQAFVQGYYKTNNEAPPASHLATIADNVELIKEQVVNNFLKNPQEILRVALGVAVFALIDEAKMGRFLQQPPSKIVAGLAEQLNESKQTPLIREILQTIANGNLKNIRDNDFRERISELKVTYSKMRNAGKDEKLEKTGEYKIALIQVIDYLFTHADVSKDVETWTVHLIPPFLDQWKNDFFKGIGESMLKLHQSYEKDGMFNDTWWKLKIMGGKTIPEKTIYPRIREMIRVLPVIEERQTALQNAAIALFPVIIDPFFNATFQKGAFRTKVENIIGSKDFACPTVNENTWQAYISAYTDFFLKLAQKIKE